ncbi:uncharacterized protein LOC142620883 [Castanea sativa]|uniref:uncharacterized protein LOC142620883 n=1 Tax=Castanea sativa TaxID=21020 RepID=UPI003F652AE5
MEEEMDSLFEGMVLFNPTQLASDQDQQNHHQEQQQQQQQQQGHQDNHHDPINPPPPIPIDAPTTTATTADSESTTSSLNSNSHSLSQPLDENLFSDLTIVAPLETLPQSQNSSSTPSISTTTRAIPSISRQVSRKKKRAGLRIGYGRDGSRDAHSHFSPLDLDSDSHSIQSDSLDDLPHTEDHNLVSSTPTKIDHDDDDDDNQTTAQVQQEEQREVKEEQQEEAKKEQQQQEAKKVEEEKGELSLEDIKAQIAEKLKGARELVASVSAARKESIRRRRKAAENVNVALIKHRELEKELEEACEAEDFEKAERVSDSLAAAEEEKLSFLIALREAEAESDANESNMQEALQAQIAAEELCVSLLHKFATDAAHNAELLLKTAEESSSKEMDKWLSSTEALEVKKMEVEIESHLINEAREVFNNSIEHSIEDDRKEQELLCSKKDMLRDELEKLLELVKQKEKEISENDSEIKEVEERIGNVISGFQEMQSNIDAKCDNLQSSLSTMDLESEALSAKKKEINEFLKQEEEKGAKLRELASASAEEAQTYLETVELRKTLMSSMLNSREDKMRLVKAEEKLSEDVQVLQQEVSTARASLQELSARKSNIQQDLASFKQRILFINKRVPEVEAEKKIAAAARNFKEAARIAAEAKSLSVEKEGIQIDMERTTSELEKLEEEIKDTVNRLQDTEGLILSKEKEVAMARFQRLLLIAGAATAERNAALEFGDLEEANLLLAEAEAADSEAKKLQPIYNFKVEEFENLPKHFISMELVSNLGRKQLAELAAAVSSSPS